MGYEILATLAILFIIKSAISFSISMNKKSQSFKRPV